MSFPFLGGKHADLDVLGHGVPGMEGFLRARDVDLAVHAVPAHDQHPRDENTTPIHMTMNGECHANVFRKDVQLKKEVQG